MRILTFDRPHNLGKLQDEIVAAIPELAPVGEGMDRQARISVSGDGKTLTVGVPDDFEDDQALVAVIDAHDPAPTPEPPPIAAIEDRVADAAAAAVGAVLPFVAPGATPADIVAAQDAARDAAREAL